MRDFFTSKRPKAMKALDKRMRALETETYKRVNAESIRDDKDAVRKYLELLSNEELNELEARFTEGVEY